MRRIAPVVLAASLLILLGACGSSTAKVSSSKSSGSKSSATTTATGGSGTVIEVSDSSLGKIITNGSGMTLYMFKPDTPKSSACNSGCSSAWPPVAAPGKNGTGVDDDDLGTITRSDGTKQVTFYGHPLYTYGGDSAPGDVTGQGSGGSWFVLNAAGNPVTGSGSATATTAAPSGSPTTMTPTTMTPTTMGTPPTTSDSGYGY